MNDKGELTKEGLELWLPAVRSSYYGKKYTKDEEKRLLLLISTAPKSEQIFFISSANPNIISSIQRKLGNALLELHTWHRTRYKGKRHDLHFSFGVIESLQVAKYGINGAAASRAN